MPLVTKRGRGEKQNVQNMTAEENVGVRLPLYFNYEFWE